MITSKSSNSGVSEKYIHKVQSFLSTSSTDCLVFLFCGKLVNTVSQEGREIPATKLQKKTFGLMNIDNI